MGNTYSNNVEMVEVKGRYTAKNSPLKRDEKPEEARVGHAPFPINYAGLQEIAAANNISEDKAFTALCEYAKAAFVISGQTAVRETEIGGNPEAEGQPFAEWLKVAWTEESRRRTGGVPAAKREAAVKWVKECVNSEDEATREDAKFTRGVLVKFMSDEIPESEAFNHLAAFIKAHPMPEKPKAEKTEASK